MRDMSMLNYSNKNIFHCIRHRPMSKSVMFDGWLCASIFCSLLLCCVHSMTLLLYDSGGWQNDGCVQTDECGHGHFSVEQQQQHQRRNRKVKEENSCVLYIFFSVFTIQHTIS